MVTRSERNTQIKIKMRIKRAAALLITSCIVCSLLYLIISYVNVFSYDVKITYQWHKCYISKCKYKVIVKNTSEREVMSSLTIRGKVVTSNSMYSNVIHEFHTEKIKLELIGKQQKEITGLVKIQDRDSFLTFKVLPL